MLECWHQETEQRPSFMQIFERFEVEIIPKYLGRTLTERRISIAQTASTFSSNRYNNSNSSNNNSNNNTQSDVAVGTYIPTDLLVVDQTPTNSATTTPAMSPTQSVDLQPTLTP